MMKEPQKEKIEANKTSILLHSKSNGENLLSILRSTQGKFRELEGSEKERCQRNLAKLHQLQGKLLESQAYYDQQLKICLAVFFIV